MKVFLRYAPTERPLLLLQDGASAHLGINLIDAAIANDVILLCFPPKLTHILQPCDVGIYRTMKANVAHTRQQSRLLRGEMWVNKGKIPAILREDLHPITDNWSVQEMWHCPFQQKLDRQRPDEISDRRNRHRRAEAGRGIAVSGASGCRGTDVD